jgi:hypothetical protein
MRKKQQKQQPNLILNSVGHRLLPPPKLGFWAECKIQLREQDIALRPLWWGVLWIGGLSWFTWWPDSAGMFFGFIVFWSFIYGVIRMLKNGPF